MILEATTHDEAIELINKFKSYQPYKYGGKWYIAIINNTCYCFRTKKSILSKLIKYNEYNVELTIYN